MPTIRFTSIIAALIVPTLTPTAARAQPPEGTQPPNRVQVAADAVSDDNVFSSPSPIADFIERVSPALDVRRTSSRLELTSLSTLDMERFLNHSELSTPVARAATSFQAIGRPAPQTTVSVNLGYSNTQTPADLNITTGLAAARVRVWNWTSGAEVRRLVTPTVTLGGRYRFSGEYGPSDIRTQNAEFWWARKVSSRTEFRINNDTEWFDFAPGDTIPSEKVTAGVSHKLSETIGVNVDAGGRYTQHSLRPELEVALARLGRNEDIVVRYSVDTSTAIGVADVIEVQRAQADFAYHPSNGTRAAVEGAIFVNMFATTPVRVYRISATFGKVVSSHMLLRAAYTRELQEGNASFPQIERNVLSAGVVVFNPRAR